MDKNYNIKIVSTDQAYEQTMAIRRRVFVEEYGIPPEKEYDGNDHSSTHILALDNGEPVGTMRIRYFSDFVKFERMCVLPAYRKTDLSEQIMHKGMIFAAQKGYKTIYGVCKKELLARWKRNGFEPIDGVEPVEQNGMTLVPVCCPLPKVPQTLSFQSHPTVLNAREGDWFDTSDSKEPVTSDMHLKLRQTRERMRFSMVLQSPRLTPDQLKNLRFLNDL